MCGYFKKRGRYATNKNASYEAGVITGKQSVRLTLNQDSFKNYQAEFYQKPGI
jgi:hypothetical protein